MGEPCRSCLYAHSIPGLSSMASPLQSIAPAEVLYTRTTLQKAEVSILSYDQHTHAAGDKYISFMTY